MGRSIELRSKAKGMGLMRRLSVARTITHRLTETFHAASEAVLVLAAPKWFLEPRPRYANFILALVLYTRMYLDEVRRLTAVKYFLHRLKKPMHLAISFDTSNK